MNLWSRRRQSSPPSTKSRRRRPSLEVLEGRTAPAVFVVNTFDDTVEAVRDGSGLDANGSISLRSAIMGANDAEGEHVIILPAGTYSLGILPADANDDDSGNLNIGRGLTRVHTILVGVSAEETVIDAGYLDQGLSVGFFATATLANLSIINGLGGFGGNLANSGQLTLSGVALRGGIASHGGGLFSTGPADLQDVTMEGNIASHGGGMHNSGTMTVTTSTFAGNYAEVGGGLFNNNTLTLTRSTVADNFATFNGGGVYNQGQALTIANSTLAQNFVTNNGAGLFTFGSSPVTLTNSTVAYNFALGQRSAGGGIFHGGGSQELRLKNSLVAHNWAASAPNISAPVVSLGHNLVSDATGANGFGATDLIGTGQSPLDPLIGLLADNGGPTRTIALLADSPAIDAGDGEGAPSVDQRGVTRDALIDIGAFEFLDE